MKKLPSIEMTTICPYCRTQMDSSVNLDDDTLPMDGDMSMCFDCGQFSYFDTELDGKLRLPNKVEKLLIDSDPRLREVHVAWLAAKGPTSRDLEEEP